MIKNIKKSLKYLIIFVGIIFMVPSFLYLLLQNAEVQTYLVNRITRHFSTEIKSTITVGKLNYKFFNRIVINDLLIKDENLDTLLYTNKITAGLKRFDIKNRSFRLGRVIAIKPLIAFTSDSTGTLNIQRYIALAGISSDSTIKRELSFTIDQIDISDAMFLLNNSFRPAGKALIDFNKLNISRINGIIEDLKVINDTTSFNIYNLAFLESSGFNVSRMNSAVIIADHSLLLNSASLNCDSSSINLLKLRIEPDSSDSFKNFAEEVRLEIIFDKSLIHSYDLQYFMPVSLGISQAISLSGRVYGTISELRGRNIDLLYNEFTHLACDFDFSGLPNIDNTFLYIGVNSLKTNAKDFTNFIIPGKGTITIPEMVYNLGDISFDGSFTGFTTDFVTYGKFRTDQGIISTDISFRPEESGTYKLKGMLTGNNIDLGGLTGKTELLGNLSLRTNVDGYITSSKKFGVDMTGNIDSLELNKYIYRNIELKGLITEKTWDGRVNIVDENLEMDLLGLLNFQEELPAFDFTLNIGQANLFNLNFDDTDSSSAVTMLVTSNFKGNSIDNLDGEIKILDSKFTKYGNDLELNNFSIVTFTENYQPVLSLRTDFMDADIRGHYNFATLGTLFNSTLSTLMPSQFEAPDHGKEQLENDFSFNINFKNTDKINSFFQTGILLADKSYLNGEIFTDSLISFEGKAKYLNFRNNIFNDLSVQTFIKGDEMTLDIYSSSLTLLGQSEQKAFSVDLNTKPDNFILSVNWDNKDQEKNKGTFIARGNIAQGSNLNDNSVIIIDIDSTEVSSQSEIWTISQASIRVDTTSISFEKVNISNEDHYYRIDGVISEDPIDTLHLDFNGIDISPLNLLVRQMKGADPNMISLDFEGLLSGKILLNNVYKNLLLVSNIDITNFSLLKSGFGTISVISALDLDRKIININAVNNLDGQKMIDIEGYYDPEIKKIDLSAKANKLPVDALNSLLKVFASNITGSASGKVNFSGVPNNFVLDGVLLVENTSLKIDYLQTFYKINDSIRFDKRGIIFNNLKLTDERGSSATLSGIVTHNNFKDYNANITINIPSSVEFQVLNTKIKDNELFYGTAYASGVTTIKSVPGAISFDISAKTGKNTKFNIPLTSGLSVSEYSFISFVDKTPAKEGEDNTENIILIPDRPKQTGIILNFDLEITPDAEVLLVFDSKVGDVMRGHGSSNLNINLDQKGNFTISGDYIIDDGDYLFTLGNILNKPFSVENGGKIMFNGNLEDAEIELLATYKNLKTSLFPLLQDEKFSDRIAVEPQIQLSEKLFNPNVEFHINLPYADKETNAIVQNTISTEEELNRQVFALLVTNSFIPLGSSSGATAMTGTSAMAATTFEMISNQLSHWLSQISNDWDVGLHYRPGDLNKDINPQELELALKTQLLNDKVMLNGNFDVRGTGNSAYNTNQISGDFDAEIKITEKIRFKVFNRYNNPYTGKLAPYTQGIGIFYKEDFDRFSDLFNKKTKSDLKKEEEIKVNETK